MTTNCYLSRSEAAVFLKENGFSITKTYLAKLACLGGGPLFQKFGSRALYRPTDLIEWALARLSSPVASTSELARASK